MEKEYGPIYGVELIDSLPIGGGIRQALPSRKDLTILTESKLSGAGRVAAGYEVLLAHYQEFKREKGARDNARTA